MRVTLNDNQSQQEKELKYPLLAKRVESGMIVMFLSATTGVVISANYHSFYAVGHYSTGWIEVTESIWEILPKGVTITLEND